MIALLIDGRWVATGPRSGAEQDLEGLLEPPGAVTAGDECGVDDPPRTAGLAGIPAHRIDLLLGDQDGRGGPAGLGSAGEARGVGAGRGPVRNHKGRAQFVDCVRMVHLRRDFQAMIDRGGESAEVGRRLLEHSDALFEWWHRVRDGTLARSSFRTYVAAMRPSLKGDLERGTSCAHPKTAGPCRELLAGETHLWTFVRVCGIEPTNNDAERALRHGVIYRKLSGGTDSESGSRFVERILSVVATCRQQDINVLDYLTRCYQAHLDGQPAPSLLPASSVNQAA